MVDAELHRFDERYALGADAMVAVERQALGTDYGANGYTTLAEADEIGAVLDLRTGSHLLDLGSGCGWPGLHLARRSGCRLTSADPVATGVARSVERARNDGITAHLGVVADGAELPFVAATFDAIVHVDVLC